MKLSYSNIKNESLVTNKQVFGPTVCDRCPACALFLLHEINYNSTILQMWSQCLLVPCNNLQ